MVVERCGPTRSSQLRAFIDGLVEGITTTGQVGMRADLAEALAALRAFNYEHIYLRPASVAQAEAVIAVLQALVEHFADRPNACSTPDRRPGRRRAPRPCGRRSPTWPA